MDLADLEREAEQWRQALYAGLPPESAKRLRHLLEVGERSSKELSALKSLRRMEARRPAMLYLGWPSQGKSVVLRPGYVDVQLTAPETAIMKPFTAKGWPNRVPKAQIGADGSGRTPWSNIRKKLPGLIESHRGHGGGVQLTERVVVVKGA